MKKLITTLLVLILAFSVAYAISVDLGEMSDEQLIELETKIQAEKIARGIAKSATIYPGEYIIGIDIPAGIYSVTTEKGAADHLYVYNVNGKQVGSYAVGTSSSRSPIGKLELKDGYKIEFSDCTLIFTVYSGGILFQ